MSKSTFKALQKRQRDDKDTVLMIPETIEMKQPRRLSRADIEEAAAYGVPLGWYTEKNVVQRIKNERRRLEVAQLYERLIGCIRRIDTCAFRYTERADMTRHVTLEMSGELASLFTQIKGLVQDSIYLTTLWDWCSARADAIEALHKGNDKGAMLREAARRFDPDGINTLLDEMRTAFKGGRPEGRDDTTEILGELAEKHHTPGRQWKYTVPKVLRALRRAKPGTPEATARDSLENHPGDKGSYLKDLHKRWSKPSDQN